MKRIFNLVLAIILASLTTVSFAQALPKELEPGKAKPKVILLEFSAPWCLSCQKLKPTMESLQKELGSDMLVHYINVDKAESEKYITLYKIESAPAFILYNKNGKLVQSIQRDITPAELKSLIKGIISKS